MEYLVISLGIFMLTRMFMALEVLILAAKNWLNWLDWLVRLGAASIIVNYLKQRYMYPACRGGGTGTFAQRKFFRTFVRA